MELFFKWIKQNLRIKGFYGTTENAVKTQVWVAYQRVCAGGHRSQMELKAKEPWRNLANSQPDAF